MGNSHPNSSPGKNNPKSNHKTNLFVRSSTWTRESHGLFDYEGKNLLKKVMKTSIPGKIIRIGHDVHIVKDNNSQEINGRIPTSNNLMTEKELAQITLNDGDYWIQACKKKPKPVSETENKTVDDGIWMVIRSGKTTNSTKGYKFEEGDLIKLGRVKFRVKEIQIGQTAQSSKKSSTKQEESHGGVKINLEEQFKKKGAVLTGTEKAQNDAEKSQSQLLNCRICLAEDAENDNPFISPCHCAGTMKLVHIKCLQHWLSSKLQTKQNGAVTTYYWKTFECELCKFAYPHQFFCDGKSFHLVDVPKPNAPYLTLEILSKDQTLTRGLYVINMAAKSTIRLGRGHDSDIRVTDISVSRHHGFIKLERGSLYLEDNNSKFGTLVQMNGPLRITRESDIVIQIGRTMLSFAIQKKKSKIMNCFRGDNSDDEESRAEGIMSEKPVQNDEFIPEAGQNLQIQSDPDDLEDDGPQVAEENSNSPEVINSGNVNIEIPNNQ